MTERQATMPAEPALVSVTALAPTEISEAKPVSGPFTPRLLYLDNLKILLVVGVIAAHAATYYIGGGEWVKHGAAAHATLLTLLGVVGLAGGLFWIGLFFLIAGMLAPASLARHGPREFLRDRMIRLGIPFAVYVLLVMPLLHYLVYAVTYVGSRSPEPLWTWLGTNVWPPDAGPLWFVADLMVFSVAYAVWWQVRPVRIRSAARVRAGHLLLLSIGIAVPSFLLHLMWPLFTRQFLDLHLSQWPQYVVLFWFGTVIAERRMSALPARTWRECGWAALVAVAAVPVLGVMGGALSGNTDLITGGWHWEAVGTVAIEGVLAVCGSLWVLELFRRHVDHQTGAARVLARSSYAAYIFHEPVLIGCALYLRTLALPVELNFLILAPVTVMVSFALAWLAVVRLRLAPGIL